MISYLNHRLIKTVTTLVVLTIILFGGFTTVRVEAATSKDVATEVFPLLVSGTNLALSAMTERSKSGVLVDTAAVSDQQITELVTRLNELMALYKSILLRQKSYLPVDISDVIDVDEVATTSPYYLKVINPNGGEEIVQNEKFNDEYKISWDGENVFRVTAYLIDQRKGLNNKVGVIGSVSDMYSSMYWDAMTVRSSLNNGKVIDVVPGYYKIHLEGNYLDGSFGTSTIHDVSDNFFKIVSTPTQKTSIKILTPKGGELIGTNGAPPLEVKWSTQNSGISEISLIYNGPLGTQLPLYKMGEKAIIKSFEKPNMSGQYNFAVPASLYDGMWYVEITEYGTGRKVRIEKPISISSKG